jgi:hypothetical protein
MAKLKGSAVEKIMQKAVLQLPFHVECPAAMFSVTGVLQLAVT